MKMKKTKVVLSIIILLASANLFSQPTIIFTPSDGVTLTHEDVDNTLDLHGLTREDSFHAVSDAERIGDYAFYHCENLISIDFPNITVIPYLEFAGCNGLTSVSFGTGHTEPTIIYLEYEVFLDVPTTNVDLILGYNVLPLPDTINNIWSDNYYGSSYVWKSITIYVGIEEKTNNQSVCYVI